MDRGQPRVIITLGGSNKRTHILHSDLDAPLFGVMVLNFDHMPTPKFGRSFVAQNGKAKPSLAFESYEGIRAHETIPQVSFGPDVTGHTRARCIEVHTGMATLDFKVRGKYLSKLSCNRATAVPPYGATRVD